MIQHAPADQVPAPVAFSRLSPGASRTGMRSLADLVGCLVRYYEAQGRAQDAQRIREGAVTTCASRFACSTSGRPAPEGQSSSRPAAMDHQLTFLWFD